MNTQTANLLFIAAMVGVFYLLVLRPQQKRVAAQRAMVAAIQVGDEIVTAGGIFARVVAVGDRLRIRTVDGSELELAPQAVGQVIRADAAEQGADA